MSDKDIQTDEICALKSIYTEEELVILEESEIRGQFYAHTDLPKNCKVVFRDLRLKDSCHQVLEIKFLPPIVLHFKLPEKYPSVLPPEFKLSSSWLGRHKMCELVKELDRLWAENEGMEILFTWTQFLKDDVLKFLKMEDVIDISSGYTFYLRKKKRLELKKVRTHTPKNVETIAVDAAVTRNTKELTEGGKHLEEKSSAPPLLQKRMVKYRRDRGRRKYRNGSESLDRRGHGHHDNKDADRGDKLPEFSGTVLHASTSTASQKSEYRVREHRKKNNRLCDEYSNRTENDRPYFVSPVQVLTDFDTTKKKSEFIRHFHPCSICFEDKNGTHCMIFDACGHVFCKWCISKYFEVRIKDGSVLNMVCPQEGCSTEATASQVRELVSSELFAKYDAVLLSTVLATLPDMTYCPRSWCRYPVEKGTDKDMATCPSCQYTFCTHCSMVYHGVEPCRYKDSEKQRIVEEYRGGDPETRARMEQRYGKKQLQLMTDTVLSETWISSNSQTCPHCKAAIEKAEGCNKMVCWQCNTLFCWICHVRLNPAAPYKHFTDSKSPCFNMLFFGAHDELDSDEGEEFDEEDGDNEDSDSEGY